MKVLPAKIFFTRVPSAGSSAVGLSEGVAVGSVDGAGVGLVDGKFVGRVVGVLVVGLKDGATVGLTLGSGGSTIPGISSSANLSLRLSGSLVPVKETLYSKNASLLAARRCIGAIPSNRCRRIKLCSATM